LTFGYWISFDVQSHPQEREHFLFQGKRHAQYVVEAPIVLIPEGFVSDE
jgi:hypothetical protein